MGFIVRGSGTLVGNNYKQKNKRRLYISCHLSASCHPQSEHKSTRKSSLQLLFSVNLQTRMGRIHWQIAVTEKRTLQWTNPFKHCAFWREWPPAKSGHWSCIAILSYFNGMQFLSSALTLKTSILDFFKDLITDYHYSRDMQNLMQRSENVKVWQTANTTAFYLCPSKINSYSVTSLKYNFFALQLTKLRKENSHSLVFTLSQSPDFY